jgi:hypothetical protein
LGAGHGLRRVDVATSTVTKNLTPRQAFTVALTVKTLFLATTPPG